MKKENAYTPESIDVLKPPSTWLDQMTGLADFLDCLESDEGEELKELKAPPPGTPNRIFQLANLLEKLAQDEEVEDPELNESPESESKLFTDLNNIFYLDFSGEEHTPQNSKWPEELGQDSTNPDVSIKGPDGTDYIISTEFLNDSSQFDQYRPAHPRPNLAIEPTDVQPPPTGEPEGIVGIEPPEGTEIPGGRDKQQILEAYRGELSEKFLELEQFNELFKYDKRYALSDVLKGWNVSKWMTNYSKIDIDMVGLTTNENLKSSKSNIKKLKRIEEEIDHLIHQAEESVQLMEEVEIEIPAGILVYDLTEGFLRNWPIVSKAVATGEEEKVVYEDRSATMKTFLLADGRYLAISKESLEDYKTKRLKPSYYIQRGTKVFDVISKKVTTITRETPISMNQRKVIISDYDPTLMKELLKKDDKGLENAEFYHVLDMINQRHYIINYRDRKSYDYSEEEIEASIFSVIPKLGGELGIEDTSDRGPNAWRDYAETQPITLKTNVVDDEKPFATPPSQGAVPFLTMPNMGDTGADLAKGKAGDAEYAGKSSIPNSAIREKYEEKLKSAKELGASALVEYYEERLKLLK